jgi:hypothetical protein
MEMITEHTVKVLDIVCCKGTTLFHSTVEEFALIPKTRISVTK